MPLIVKDYQWTETKERIFITVPLKGVKRAKADMLCTEEFVKVSYPPFLFEAVLYAAVDDERSSATIRDGCVTFNLCKKEQNLWGQLLSIHADDKAFVLKKKQEAIEFAQNKAQEIQKRKSTIKEQNKKFSLKEMMKLEELDRSRIEGIKVAERDRAMSELTEWKEKKRLEAEQEKLELIRQYEATRLMDENKSEDSCRSTEIFDEGAESDDDRTCKIIELSDDIVEETGNGFHDSKGTCESVEYKTSEKTEKTTKRKKPERKQSSGPRNAGKISVNFTRRVFPTPQRESKIAEEDEWLQKQAEARKQLAINDPDLAEHEKDPTWLKDKGGQLFASGDFRAAVNAFNLAIKIQPKMPILFLNRAACHLKLRNLYKCAEDSSTALELMVPKVEANAKGRLKGHLRRAAAFCELELYVEALQDYDAALNIDPKNEALKQDAEKIRTVIQSSAG